MNSLYIASSLESIKDKLDRQLFKGQTFDEMKAKIIAGEQKIPKEEIIAIRAMYDAIRRGLTREQKRASIAKAVLLWKTEGQERPSEFLEPLPFTADGPPYIQPPPYPQFNN